MEQVLARVHNIDEDKLNTVLTDTWAGLKSDEGAEFAKRRGVDLDALNLEAPCPFVTKLGESQSDADSGGNLTVVEAIIVGVVAAQINHALKLVWDKIIVPQLEASGNDVVPEDEEADT